VIEIRRTEYGDPRAVVLREAMDVDMGALYADVGGDSSPSSKSCQQPSYSHVGSQ
jgi:hypothetical protein